jgi:hypothetical protein
VTTHSNVWRFGKPPPAGSRANYAANVMRALEILADEPLSIPRLAERLLVDGRTARRLVYSLTYEGFLVREASNHRRRFAIGPRARELGPRMAAAPTVNPILDWTYPPGHGF